MGVGNGAGEGIWGDEGVFSLAPILQQPNLDKAVILECDASDKATGAVLGQIFEDEKLHPIAFMSKTLSPAERNYNIYDKELLAVIRAFKEWRHWLEGTAIPVMIVTDHKNLEYFMTTKSLTKRQNRWAIFLSEFNFKIRYRPGGLNAKAAALRRREGDLEGGVVPSKPLLNPEIFEEMGAMGMRVEILQKNGRLPVLGSKGAAGYDLYCAERTSIKAHTRGLVKTGIAIGIPKGCYGRIAPRSGLSMKGIDVGAGVIDKDYTGELMVLLINNGKE